MRFAAAETPSGDGRLSVTQTSEFLEEKAGLYTRVSGQYITRRCPMGTSNNRKAAFVATTPLEVP
jgi:hypothetical protein